MVRRIGSTIVFGLFALGLSIPARAIPPEGVFIHLYQHTNPWSGDRIVSVLEELGFVRDQNLAVFSTINLLAPIPINTRVVIISSNSNGAPSAHAVAKEWRQ